MAGVGPVAIVQSYDGIQYARTQRRPAQDRPASKKAGTSRCLLLQLYGPAPPWQASRLTDLMSVTSQVDADREETVFDGLVVIM